MRRLLEWGNCFASNITNVNCLEIIVMSELGIAYDERNGSDLMLKCRTWIKLCFNQIIVHLESALFAEGLGCQVHESNGANSATVSVCFIFLI